MTGKLKKFGQQVSSALDMVEKIHKIQGVQAENHLMTIQTNTTVLPSMAADTVEIRDNIKDLVGYLRAKAEDGRL